MRLRAGLLALALVASCALLVKPTQGQNATNPVQCALSSVTTTCTVFLAGNFQPGGSYSCTVDTSGTWSGQLDFNVVGLETAAPGSALPANGGNLISNTTSNGFWTLPVINASQFQVLVDTPGSFTGTANVGIRCAVGMFTTSTVKSASGAGGATPIPTPTNGIYPVAQSSVPWSVACLAAYPCGEPTPIPFPTLGVVQVAAPSATTPVSCATPNCNVAAFQATGTNLHMVFDNATPIPGTTPIPGPTGTTSPWSVAGFTSTTGTPVMPTACNGAPISYKYHLRDHHAAGGKSVWCKVAHLFH